MASFDSRFRFPLTILQEKIFVNVALNFFHAHLFYLRMKLHFICVFLLLRNTHTCRRIHFRACSHHSCSGTLTGGVHCDNTTPHIDFAFRLYINSTVGLHKNFICGNNCIPTNELTVSDVPKLRVTSVDSTNNSFGGVSAVLKPSGPMTALTSSSPP